MDAEVESVMASSQDQREEELQVKLHPSFCRICISTAGTHCALVSFYGPSRSIKTF